MQQLCFTVTRVHASAIATKHRQHACPPLIFAAALSLLLLQLFGHHTVSVTPQLPITSRQSDSNTTKKDTTWRRPLGPGTLKTFSFDPADTAEQVGGLERRRKEERNIHRGKFLLKPRKQKNIWFTCALRFTKKTRCGLQIQNAIAHFVLQIEDVPMKKIHCAAETNTVCFTRAKKNISLVIFTIHSRTKVPIKYLFNAN